MLVGKGYSYNDILILPRYSDVMSRSDVDLSTQLTKDIKLRIPIISSCMDTVTEDTMAIELARQGGLGIIHRFCSIEEQVEMVNKVKREWTLEGVSLLVGAAVGATGDYLERTAALVSAGVNILCVDVAHGHHKLCGNAVMEIREAYENIPIIAGNVCTASGVEYLVDCGADVIRLGCGQGSICTTRVQTGCGYPQFSAVLECSKKAKELGVTTIADGGFSGAPGNLFKALAVGASACMMGKSFAGTTESPGEIIHLNNRRMKRVRGMAGKEANASKFKRTGEKRDICTLVPEGVEGYIDYKGDLVEVLREKLGGIRSGFSYQGCHTLKELHDLLSKGEIRYCTITSSGLEESRSHGLHVAI